MNRMSRLSNLEVIEQTIKHMEQIAAQLAVFLMDTEELAVTEREKDAKVASLKAELAQLEELNIQAQRIAVLKMSYKNIAESAKDEGPKPKVNDIMAHLRGLTPSKFAMSQPAQQPAVPESEDIGASLS